MDKYKKVLRILKEMGIYERYTHYFLLNYNCGKTGLKDFLKNHADFAVGRLLDFTLTWSCTKEGRGFWREKNDEFQYRYYIDIYGHKQSC